jgi:uncharacterized membrane protein
MSQVFAAESAPAGSTRLFAHINYGLLGAGLFTGWLTAVIAVIIAYVLRSDARGTVLESHYAWQIRTFWWGLLWTALGGLLFILVIGMLGPSYIIWAVAWLWGLYRVLKGWIKLASERPVM